MALQEPGVADVMDTLPFHTPCPDFVLLGRRHPGFAATWGLGAQTALLGLSS